MNNMFSSARIVLLAHRVGSIRSLLMTLVSVLVCCLSPVSVAGTGSEPVRDFLIEAERFRSSRPPSIRTVDHSQIHQSLESTDIERSVAIVMVDGQKADIKIQRWSVQSDGNEEMTQSLRAIWDGEKYLIRQSGMIPGKELRAVHLTDKSYSGVLTWQDEAGGFLEGRFRCDIGTGADWIDVLQLALDEDVQIVSSQRDIDGHTCVELLAHTREEARDKTYHLWVDPHSGYHIRRASIVITENEPVDHSSEDPAALRSTRREYHIDDVTIEKISNYFVPTKGKKQTKFFYSDGTVETNRIETVVSKIEFNPDFEAMGAFVMDWPEGTIVRDLDTKLRYQWEDNTLVPYDRVVKDPVNPEQVIGTPAPSFILPKLNGKQIKLSDLDGKVVILQFWATWVTPSAETLSVVEDIANQYEDRGVVFVTINVQEEPETVRSFLQQNEFDFIVALDRDGETAMQYRSSSILQTMLLDVDGIIRTVLISGGSDLEDKLKEELDCLLGR